MYFKFVRINPGDLPALVLDVVQVENSLRAITQYRRCVNQDMDHLLLTPEGLLEIEYKMYEVNESVYNEHHGILQN